MEADILLTGDTFWNRDYPFIDYGREAASTARYKQPKPTSQESPSKLSSFPDTEPWAARPTWFYSETYCWRSATK